jgi:integrase
VRIHLEAIIDRATARGYRIGDNPASLKGPLGVLLPQIGDVHTPQHLASLPYQEIGAFVAQLKTCRPIKTASKMAVEQLLFVILTAVRVGETHQMRWTEIDWENRLWNCPWERTKTGKKTRKDHVVPLSEAAFAILTKLQALQKEAGLELDFQAGIKRDFVFVRALPHPDCPIYYNKKRRLRQRELASVPLPRSAAVLLLQRSLGRKDITVHGFRTTFSSWANDMGCYDREVIEMALDHAIGNQVERIYSRDAQRLEQRRKLMEDWGRYCTQSRQPADVIQISASKVKG